VPYPKDGTHRDATRTPRDSVDLLHEHGGGLAILGSGDFDVHLVATSISDSSMRMSSSAISLTAVPSNTAQHSWQRIRDHYRIPLQRPCPSSSTRV
jgi:hypothetical protein